MAKVINTISTHSLTKRLTSLIRGASCMAVFQLTASRRGWRFASREWRLLLNISTHSLTKRLTLMDFIMTVIYWIFQLTASRRGWLDVIASNSDSAIFQLTASRRGWHSLWFRKCGLVMYFNSQPHEEADCVCFIVWLPIDYFNSQPHEEADRYPALAHITLQHISTHSLTKRLTSPVHPLLILPVISTHSLTKRLTSSRI